MTAHHRALSERDRRQPAQPGRRDDGSGLKTLSLANFAMVMATGALSIGFHEYGFATPARVLLAVNVLAWTILAVATAGRLVRYPRLAFRELTDHVRGPESFAVIAATAVLGAQFVLIAGLGHAAIALWLCAIALWLVLTYVSFVAFVIKNEKPALERGISGAWLLLVVATQSVVVLSALVVHLIDSRWSLAVNFWGLSLWLWGGVEYVLIMGLIFYRHTFYRMAAADMRPSTWINMGAMAISTLAGTLLIANAADEPLLHDLLPFLKGFTVLFWAAGTWWIPVLIALTVWRYVHQRFPLRYGPEYWSAVFPLCMYADCTRAMAASLDVGVAQWLASSALVVASAAWCFAMAGLLRWLWRYGRSLWP